MQEHFNHSLFNNYNVMGRNTRIAATIALWYYTIYWAFNVLLLWRQYNRTNTDLVNMYFSRQFVIIHNLLSVSGTYDAA